MNDFVSTPPPRPAAQDHSLIRRRKSISNSVEVVPSNLILLQHNSASSTTTATTIANSASDSYSSSSSFPSDDIELLSVKPASQSYISLKDLLPSVAVYSPSPSSSSQDQIGSDICIRNRLVKQAAWAYLQPMSMSISPNPAENGFFHRLWPRVASFFDFLNRQIVRALNWILRSTKTRSSR